MEKKKWHATKYGSRVKTSVVNLSTLGLFIAWGYTFSISGELFSAILFYLFYGFLANRTIGVPITDDLAHLNFSDRLWLRTFHAWLWPVYVFGRSSSK
jgi:hypothetical protein